MDEQKKKTKSEDSLIFFAPVLFHCYQNGRLKEDEKFEEKSAGVDTDQRGWTFVTDASLTVALNEDFHSWVACCVNDYGIRYLRLFSSLADY